MRAKCEKLVIECFRMPLVKKPKSRIGVPNRCLSYEPNISRQKQAQIWIRYERARLLIYDSTEFGANFSKSTFRCHRMGFR